MNEHLLSWHAQRSAQLRCEADVSRLLASARDTRRAARFASRAAALAARVERRAVPRLGATPATS